jgi:arylsulfatase
LPDLSFGASPWASLPPKTRRLFARYQEVYAGVVAGLDRNIGRLVAELEAMGVRENTLIVLMSDNGGSAEGSPDGALNVIGEVVGDAASEDEALAHFDHMGERGTFPHYPMGWACASNTPYRLYKQYTALGGVADPLILSWPRKIKAGGQVRRNFVHVIDLYPTLLDAAGVERPATYRGAPQKPVEGRSVLATFDDPAAATRTEQYYELGGFRAYEEGTWRLVAQHQRGEDFAKDHWALYDRSVDPAEITDVSDKHPDVAERLKAKWDAAAKAHNVYPLDDRNLVLKLMQTRMKDTRKSWDIRPPMRTLPADVAPSVFGVDHQIEVTFERPAGVEAGVLVSCGSYPGGFSLYLKGGRLYYEISVLPRREVLDAGPVPQGKVVVRYQQVMKVRPFDGKGVVSINGEKRVEHVFRKALVGPAYDGFAIGSDPGEQVSDAYVGANPYPAKIERVKIEIDMRPPNPAELVSFMQKLKMRA